MQCRLLHWISLHRDDRRNTYKMVVVEYREPARPVTECQDAETALVSERNLYVSQSGTTM